MLHLAPTIPCSSVRGTKEEATFVHPLPALQEPSDPPLVLELSPQLLAQVANLVIHHGNPLCTLPAACPPLNLLHFYIPLERRRPGLQAELQMCSDVL